MSQIYHYLFETNKKFFPWLSLLLENKLNDIRSKLQGHHLSLFDDVLKLKPELPNKYYQWLAKNYSDDADFLPGEVHDMLMKFDDMVKKNNSVLTSKDINSPLYSSLDKLKQIIEKGSEIISKTQEKKLVKSGGKTVYSDGKYFVIHPTNVGSACYYGSGTKWCISAKEENMFQNYTDEGVKFVMILDKESTIENPMYKVAIAFLPENKVSNSEYMTEPYEIYDSTDTLKNIEDIWEHYPKNLLDSINQYFTGGVVPTSPEEKLEKIKSLSPEKFLQTFFSYIKLLDYVDNDFAINRAENGLKYIITNGTEQQIGYIVLHQLENENVPKFVKDMLINRIKASIHGMNTQEAMNYLIQNFRLSIGTISEYNLIQTTSNPQEIYEIFKNSSDGNLTKLLMSQNMKTLGEKLTGYKTEAYFIPSTYVMLLNTFEDISEEYFGVDFSELPRKMQYAFENAISRGLYTDPKIYDWEDVAWIVYEMLQRKELKFATNKFGDRAIIYVPES